MIEAEQPAVTPVHPTVRRAIDPVDTIWLNMDRDNNLMVIESLITLDGPVDWDRFLRVLQERVVDRYPVFSQRPVPSRVPLRAPHWETDPGFALDQHVHRARLAAPGGDVELQAYVNTFLSSPLPRDRALWEMHLVDGYGDGAAIYSRLHHALADGIALTRVVLSLTDETPEPDPTPLEEPGRPRSSAAERVLHLAELSGSLAHGLPGMLTPGHAADAVTTARQTTAIATKLLFTRNPDTSVAGKVGVRKRAIWAPPIPLAKISDAGHRTGTTINDVLVAALAGALTTYLREHGNEPVDVPTMVPVNVRPLDQPLPRELGNQFALVLLSLPSGLPTPFARLAETKRRMDTIKHSPEAFLTFEMIRGIGRTGPDLERYLVNFFANKASGVTTNVPGPTATRYVAGSRITAMLGWAPESGQQTLGTCIFTYDGNVHVGFKVDTAIIEHPEQLQEAFLREVDELCRLSPVRRTSEPLTRRAV